MGIISGIRSKNMANWCMPMYNYYSKLDKEQRKQFQRFCGLSESNTMAIMYGNRSLSPKCAINMHKISNGEIPFYETCPDIDWAFVQRVPLPFR